MAEGAADAPALGPPPALPDPRSSRAVLIAAGRYADPENPGDLPSAVDSMNALRDFVRNDWNLDPSRCRLLPDPRRTDDVLDALYEATADRTTTDTLLVYYCGHGLIDDQENLLLALRDSSRVRLDKALDYGKVQWHVRRSNARRRIVVLDCCYAARAFGLQGSDLERRTDIPGAVVVAASGPTAAAVAPPGERYTAFTGALLHVLRQGRTGGPELLPLDLVFEETRAHLLRRRRPNPWINDLNGAAKLPFVLNRAVAGPRVPPEFTDEVTHFLRCADRGAAPPAHADWVVRVEERARDGMVRHSMADGLPGHTTAVALASPAPLRLLERDTDLPLCLLARWWRALGQSDVSVRHMFAELALAAEFLAPVAEDGAGPTLVLSVRPSLLDTLPALDDEQSTVAGKALLEAARTLVPGRADAHAPGRESGSDRPGESAWTRWSPLRTAPGRCGAGYAWRDLPGRLAAAGRYAERRDLVSDPHWILHRARGAGGMGAALRDLLAIRVEGHDLAEVLSPWAHLVDAADPPGTDISVLHGRSRVTPGAALWRTLAPEGPHWLLEHASDAEPPAVVRVLGGQGGPVTGCCVHEDGTLMLTTDEQGFARLWELPTGVLLATADHTKTGLGDCVLLDGHRALLLGDDGAVRLWDLQAGTAYGDPLSTAPGGFRGCRGISAGLAVCLGRGDRSVHLVKVPAADSGESLGIAHTCAHRHPVAGAAVVDGHTLLTVTDAGSISAWDIESGTRLITQSRQAWQWSDLVKLLPRSEVHRKDPEGNGTPAGDRGRPRLRLLGFGGRGEARLAAWWTGKGDEGRAPRDTAPAPAVGPWDQGPEVVAAALTEDGRRLATLDADGFATLHDRPGPDDKQAPRTVRSRAHTAAGRTLCLTRDGTRMVTAGHDGFVRLWNLDRLPAGGPAAPEPAPPVIACLRVGKAVRAVREIGTTGRARSAGTSPDSRARKPFGAPAPALVAAAPSDAGGWLLLGCEQGHVVHRRLTAAGATVCRAGIETADAVVRRTAAEEEALSPRHRTAVVAAAAAPDGTWAATIGRDGEALLWRMTGPEPSARSVGQRAFRACCFDASSRHLWLTDTTDLYDLDVSVLSTSAFDITGSHGPVGPLRAHRLPGPVAGRDDTPPPTALHWGRGVLYRAARTLSRVTEQGRVTAEQELRHPVTSLALSDDGRHLAGIGRDGLVWCWDAETLAVLACHRLMSPLTDCAWEADSACLIVGQATGVSRLRFEPCAVPRPKEVFHDRGL
ncbi:caspase, EACC1-associated type [Streptomyces griseochromogenes]|uniref:caspase, EACC1-associated type n=1 Tax=Streptomyces griseochromogenes TaxID=68214 RepID=UPI0037AD629C